MINTRVTARTPQAEVRGAYNPRDPRNVNVGQVERLLSVIGGGACVLMGIVRRDLSGLFAASLGGLLLYRGITGHSFLYKALGITTVEESPHSREVLPEHQGIKIRRSVTIMRSSEDLYQFWRRVENAPLYMQQIASVTRTGERTSHWVAQLP